MRPRARRGWCRAAAVTIATSRCARRLTRLDLPALGGPTTAIVEAVAQPLAAPRVGEMRRDFGRQLPDRRSDGRDQVGRHVGLLGREVDRRLEPGERPQQRRAPGVVAAGRARRRAAAAPGAACALVSAATRSARPSAAVRSSRPLQERAAAELAGLGRRAGRAGRRAPSSSPASTARPPWTWSSSTSSPVTLCGPGNQSTRPRSSGCAPPRSRRRRSAARRGAGGGRPVRRRQTSAQAGPDRRTTATARAPGRGRRREDRVSGRPPPLIAAPAPRRRLPAAGRASRARDQPVLERPPRHSWSGSRSGRRPSDGLGGVHSIRRRSPSPPASARCRSRPAYISEERSHQAAPGAGRLPPTGQRQGCPPCATASAKRPAPICSSTGTTRSTGSPGTQAALAAARAQDKPILLSIGYAACHWCHVMAHESFENPAIAGADEPRTSSTSRSIARSARTSTRSISMRWRCSASRAAGRSPCS